MKLRQAKKIVTSTRINRYRKHTLNRASKRMLRWLTIPYELAIAFSRPFERWPDNQLDYYNSGIL